MTLPKVLLLGKDAYSRSLESLLKKEGIEIVSAKDMEEALEHLRKTHVALILVPEDMDKALELYRKTSHISPDTRVAILTSKTESGKPHEGIYACIRWPDKNEINLLRTVRRAIFDFCLLRKQRDLLKKAKVKGEREEQLNRLSYRTKRDELEVLGSLSIELSASKDIGHAIMVAKRYIELLFEQPIFCALIRQKDIFSLYVFSPEISTMEAIKASIQNLLILHEVFSGEKVKRDHIKAFYLNGKPGPFELDVDRSTHNIQSHITFPLVAGGENLGSLSLSSTKQDAFDIYDIRIFSLISYQLAANLLTIRMLHEIQELAIKDPLTGLYNRGYFEEVLEKEYLRAKRYLLPLSIIIVDVDFFKAINDTCGHLVGDKVLKNIAKLIKSSVRRTDIAARFGGEEFVILLTNTVLAEAALLAERLRLTVQSKTLEIDGYKVNTTISGGVASLTEDISSKDEFLERADKALLAAKSRGRNRIFLYSPERKIEEFTTREPKERRRFPRAELKLPVTYSYLPIGEIQRLSGISKNISEEGIAFTGQKEIPKGEFAFLELAIPSEEGEKRINTVAQVVWNRSYNRSKDKTALMGARILAIDEKDRSLIRNLIKDSLGNGRKRKRDGDKRSNDG